MNPKVSICIPTCNSEKYLVESIESALKQSFSDFEILISDNCSSDNTQNIIKEYASKDDRIIFIFNKKNIGMVNNWNSCLARAKGEYIKFLFSDDTLSSDNALEKMVTILNADNEISLVASARNIIDEQSKKIDIRSRYAGNFKMSGKEIIMDCLLRQSNKIGEPSVVMFRKKDSARGFLEKYKQLVDLEMWFNILEKGDFYYIDKPLSSFRIHSCQQTRINIDNCDFIDDPALLLKDYLSKSYINYSNTKKRFACYVAAYDIWKLYRRHNLISKELATEKIKRLCGYGRGKLIYNYPFYRIYKLYSSARKRMTETS